MLAGRGGSDHRGSENNKPRLCARGMQGRNWELELAHG